MRLVDLTGYDPSSAQAPNDITSSNNEWKYYKEGEMVEEGTFVIEGTKFIMKHKPEEHTHEDGTVHTHEASPDHVYEFQVSSDKKQMKLMHGNQTSVYNKL